MLLIQQRESIFRTCFLTVGLILDLTIADKSTLNQRICGKNNTRRISYFKEGTGGWDWDEAWKLCKHKGSYLPVICNKNERDALRNYINANLRGSSIWTSGKNLPIDKWTWVDGQTFLNIDMVEETHNDPRHSHVVLNPDCKYSAQHPSAMHHYLCQYSGSSCNSKHVINVTKGCVSPNYYPKSWYDARNRCLDGSGDLAVLTDADLAILKESGNLNAVGLQSYWIGLKNNTWNWIWQITDDSDGEINYSDWSKIPGVLADNCISIDSWYIGWRAARCTERKRVICETSSDETTLSRSSSTTSEMSSTTTVESQIQLYSGIGAGMVIIIICIIVIILALRYTRKSHKDMNQSVVIDNSGHNKLDLTPNTQDTSVANAPVYVPLTRADDTQGVYAEISLATVNEPENGSKPQQHGIVYASLDFEKEPTYQEVN